MVVTKVYGSLEFSAYSHSEILVKIASRSLAVAITVSVPNSLCSAELLLHYGTKTQKEHYLPRLATREENTVFCHNSTSVR